MASPENPEKAGRLSLVPDSPGLARPVQIVTVGKSSPFMPPLRFIGGGVMLEEGITIIHGMPGVGKGEVACWVLSRLQIEGVRPLIIDWENRKREWVMRLTATGIDVDYAEFDALHVKDGLIADALVEQTEPYGAVIWDSASASRPPAKANDVGQEEAARTTLRVMRRIAAPVLLIAHENKSTAKASARTAYGSVAWMAEARLAWHADRKPGTSVLKLNCTKSNDVEPMPMTFRMLNGRLVQSVEKTITEREAEVSTTIASRIVDIIERRGRSLSMSEIRDAWLQDYEVDTVPARLRVTVSEQVGVTLVKLGERMNARYWVKEAEQDTIE